MGKFPKNLIGAAVALLGISAFATQSFAQEAAAGISAEGKFVFNTTLFLIGGFLVMWMAAGFAMLEAGMVRTKNVAMQCTKNVSLFAVAGIMYWVIGYNVMYEGVDGGYIGSFFPKVIPDPAKDTGDYAAASDWFFQMVFCATTASIVSGTLAERIKIWPFLIFVVVLTGIIYPIEGAWKWGAGWLYPSVPEGFDSWELAIAGGKEAIGIVGITGGVFQDFAGSTLVHSAGGWAALAGAILLGSRAGKYGPNGAVNPMPGSNMPLATLGMFILWLGWYGFNGGSQLALGSAGDASSVSRIFVNTHLAACAGVIVAIILNQLFYGKIDLTMALNGALAGLVSITAEPLAPSPIWAIIIGGIGGLIVIITVPLLDKLKIDDVVGAIPVHLIAGIWGTMAVPITNEDSDVVTQAVGVGAIGAFVFLASFLVWLILKFTIGLRPTAEEEEAGMDKTEIGLEAYPEFGSGSQRV